MKKYIIISLILYAVSNAQGLNTDQIKTILQKAYNIKLIDNKAVFKNGTKIDINTGQNPKIEEKISNGCNLNASIVAMLPSKKYPALKPLNSPLSDDGRCRNYELLGEIYGKNEKEVKENLVDVDFLGHIVKFNSKNNAAKALSKVSKDLKVLITKNPDMIKYLKNIGGTFKWRVIAGTNILSAHSYAIAIDINVAQSSYWQWQKEYSNLIPEQIVHIFEKHGFIWGGRWNHFDTMHFEYRPEFFVL